MRVHPGMNSSFLWRTAGLLVAFALSVPVHAAEKADRSPAKPAKSGTTQVGKVDINTADPAALEALPEIGTNLANAIIAARPFKSVDDLERVSGIGPAKMATLRHKVTASAVKPTAAAKPDRYSSSGPSKVSPINEGKSTERKSVSEPYDRTVARQPAEQKSAATPPRAGDTTTKRTMDKTDPSSVAGAPTGRTSPASADRARDASGRFISRADAEGRVDLNTATKEQLESLPEIGPVKAQAIIDARPFASPEEVMRVSGIKEATYEAIKDKIVVSRHQER